MSTFVKMGLGLMLALSSFSKVSYGMGEVTQTRMVCQQFSVNTVIINGLYVTLLKRKPTAWELNRGLQQLQNGIPPFDIAFRITMSQESDQKNGDLFRVFLAQENLGVWFQLAVYPQLLGRVGDEGGVMWWVSQYYSGVDYRRILALIITSDEGIQHLLHL